jgi:hypothetical protein
LLIVSSAVVAAATAVSAALKVLAIQLSEKLGKLCLLHLLQPLC